VNERGGRYVAGCPGDDGIRLFGIRRVLPTVSSALGTRGAGVSTPAADGGHRIESAGWAKIYWLTSAERRRDSG
jgi:hypothetical protein